jgi:DNA-directed RNA polymerase specialized sigma24 family protein
MNKLSAIEKQVLQLMELQEPEITTLEAAQKLGKSPGMVKTTRYRAFKKLRAEAQLQNSR